MNESAMPRLLRPLPANRTRAQLLNHFEVERAIARRLKAGSRDQRQRLYTTMYDELFSRVPDHPRLTRRQSEVLTQEANRAKFALVGPYLEASTTFAEFAPGDCKFALAVSARVRRVYGVDIADQRASGDAVGSPRNFQLVIYDGFRLDSLARESVDVCFSDQLIEHLHPDDTASHFELVRELLRPGGVYVFRTPHAFCGPHDVSKFFCEEPQGFHLKEWTYRSLDAVLQRAGLEPFALRQALRSVELPYSLAVAGERLCAWLPPRPRRALSARLMPEVCVVARKH